jgi:hypothetical protein
MNEETSRLVLKESFYVKTKTHHCLFDDYLNDVRDRWFDSC